MAPDAGAVGGNAGRHTWRFFRIGGFDQVRLDRAGDLTALNQLDQKLWLALSCPTRGLEFDTRTLDLVDTDHDGRVRVPEVIAAAEWACAVLRDPGELVEGGAALPLAAINDASPQGQALLGSAQQLLATLGKSDATVVTPEDTADIEKLFSQMKFNGDGVVPADSAEDDATKALIGNIIDCLGADTDRSGKAGVSQARAEQFFAEAQAYSDWWRKAEGDPVVLPLGDATPAAFEAWSAVRAKVDDYFTRCRLAEFDPRATTPLNRSEADYAALACKELSVSTPDVAAFPLARVEPGRPLPLDEGLNPAWADAMARLRATLVTPPLGTVNELTEGAWKELSERLAPYAAWSASKAGTAVEKLGIRRVRETLSGPARSSLAALIARDLALEPRVKAATDVDRLVHYYRDLYTLLNNFVAFPDFYNRRKKAIFQAGTLYLDGRSCDLCLPVQDVGRHAAFAGVSQCYLAYCDCTRTGGTDKASIVAAFTGGDSDFLMVGRNGVFYDRKGQDWDATITRIVENPISVRQAFWSPYKRVARFVEGQIGKFAASRDKVATDRLSVAVTQAPAPPPAGGPAPQGATPAQAFDIAKFAGIFAAIGLAMGALGTALAVVATNFLGLSPLQKVLAVIGVMLVISGPSMLLAYLKLRQRNLGPLLEANGWAVNARVKINIPFGRSLTGVAALPPGAQRSLVDPYAEKPSPWPKVIVVVAVLLFALYYLNYYGKLYEWTGVGKRAESQQTQQQGAPNQAGAPQAPAKPAPTTQDSASSPAPGTAPR